MLKPAEYCPKCGEKIEYSTFGRRYSKRTGEVIQYMDDWRCPNLRAYYGADLNGHYWKQRKRKPRREDKGDE